MTNEREITGRAGSAALLASISVIPFVGSTLSQFIGSEIAEARFKKIEQFIELYGAKMDAIREDAFDRDFAMRPEDAAYVARLIQMASETHRNAKIDLLAAITAGAARADTSNILRDRFLVAVEALTPAHVQVLNHAATQNRWFTDGRGTRDPSLGVDEIWIDDAIPGIGREDAEALLADLSADGLIHEDTTYEGARQKWSVTALGLKFLAMLAEH